MRYIKSYKLFESDDNPIIVNQVNDILQDLTDDGFSCNVAFSTYQLSVYIDSFGIDPWTRNPSVYQQSHYSKFTYSMIKNSVDHLISFLEQSGYACESAHALLDYQPIPFSFEMVKGSDEMERFELRFVKYKEQR